MKRYTFITAIMVFCLCAPLVHAGQPLQGPQVVYVQVGTVTEVEGVEMKRYTGHVNTTSSVDLVARVSGELLRIGFAEGEFVQAGQMLYELDSTRYMAEVRNIEAKIAEYEARLTYAQQKHRRAENLYAGKADTKDALDSAESEFEAARAALLAAEAQLVTVKDDLKNTSIHAPISGKIGLTEYTTGNYLTPNSGIIATIVQLDPLRVSFAIANKDYLSMFGSEKALKENSTLRLRLADGAVYEQDGLVEFLDTRANQKTDAIQVFAKFTNPNGKLVPGSTVTVLLARKNGGMQPAVVTSAVMHDSKSAYVYVVDANNKVERRNVELGVNTAAVQTIRSGLLPGELIITDGMHKTMPGGVIEPVWAEATGTLAHR